ncbi:MAG: hypothetical protein EXS00_03485 [Phycisphaerales bacterium]|nr:hypothetical protein [Phycisphaerales bacterium]
MISWPWFRWLLGLNQVEESANTIRLDWEHPLAGWVWLLVIASAVGLAAMAYSRIPRRGKRILATCRGLLVLLLVVLFARPILVEVVEERENDTVFVLLDRSRSMLVADVAAGDGAATTQTRESQLRGVIGHQVWNQVATSGRHIEWMGFHGAMEEIETGAEAEPILNNPTGWSTNIAKALTESMRRSGSRPTSGIVLVSDGRSATTVDRSLLQGLEQRAVPVFTVALGGEQPPSDISVEWVTAPERAFVRDDIPMNARITKRGLAAGTGVTVELVDESTGVVVDRTNIGPEEFSDDVANAPLIARTQIDGDAHWKVRVSSSAEDVAPSNNTREVVVEMIDRPIRVLYLDGYPRWEYRYLKNLLVREPSIDSSIMLLSADREFAQEGDTPLQRLPQGAEELTPFDVIIIGDLPASYLSATQAEAIREAVSKRGIGLLWIAGSRSTPSTWRGSALEDLLPMTPPYELDRLQEAVWAHPTELAKRLGALRLSDTHDPYWPTTLLPGGAPWAQLSWVQQIDSGNLKPTVEVLVDSEIGSAQSSPVVTTMRYGAGHSIYVATDETWRWRNGIGESLQERFWISLIRLLARPTVEGGSAPVRLEASPSRVSVGSATLLRLEVLDSKSSLSGLASVEVDVVDPSGVAAQERVTLDLEGVGANAFVGSWTPTIEGKRQVTFEAPSEGVKTTVRVEVLRMDEEMAHPESDHALLRMIAQETNGAALTPDTLAQLADMLPNRSVVIERMKHDRIWSSPLALILLLGLLGIEWTGRRWARLD